jgi:hypothetical protein
MQLSRKDTTMPKNAPKVKYLLNDLQYIGMTESKRTVYYVFQSGKDYLIFSYRDSTYRSGHFNVVRAETIERVYRVFRGEKRVTRRQVEEHPRMKSFTADFDVLQALYVMVAMKQASIDRRSLNNKALYFNFKS